MRVRETYLKDYGISEEYAKKIRAYCKDARGEKQKMILEAAQEACPDIASEIFFSLTTGAGYDTITKKNKQYIPMKRDDFQAYKRKAMEELDRKLRWNGIYL